MSCTRFHFRSSALTVLTIVVGILLGATNGAAQEALIAYEGFETEALGAFDGTADQTWTLSTAADKTIEDTGLSYSGGDLTIDGGNRKLKLSDLVTISSPVALFGFTAQAGTIYFSYLAQVQSGAYFEPWVGNSTMGDQKGSTSLSMDSRSSDIVGARLNPSSGHSWETVKTGDIGDARGGLFVVGKLFKSGAGNYDRLQLVINPTTTTEPATWDADLTGDIGVASVDRFGIRYGNTAAGWIDAIRIGTTYGSVLPEPPAGTLVIFK